MQLPHHGVAAAMIFLAHGGEILRPDAVERRGRDLVERRDGEPRLTVFQCLRHKLHIPADEAADARAAGGEPLRHGVNQDQIFIAIAKLQERQQLTGLIGKLAVDLVGDQVEIVFHGHVEDHFHLVPRQARAGRVAGIRDHDGLCLRRDARLDLFAVCEEIALLRLRVQGMDTGAGRGDKGMIVRIERLWDDDLVAVVQNTVARDLERFAPARGDEHIPRVQRHADARIIAADRVDQRRDAGRGRVGQRGLVEAADGLEQLRGRLNIRLADIQMIDLFACCRRCDRIGVEFTHG